MNREKEVVLCITNYEKVKPSSAQLKSYLYILHFRVLRAEGEGEGRGGQKQACLSPPSMSSMP
jgi:hypothetical protein